MRVRMNIQISGTRDGVAWPAPGETVTLPDDEAKTLIASRAAEKVDEPKPAKAEPKAAARRSTKD